VNEIVVEILELVLDRDVLVDWVVDTELLVLE
jgi:hypothetical protein